MQVWQVYQYVVFDCVWVVGYDYDVVGQVDGFFDVVGDEDDGFFEFVLDVQQLILQVVVGQCIEGIEGFVYEYDG